MVGLDTEIVYIAGPITGKADYRYDFAQAAADLERAGFIVLNPAVLPEGMEPAHYMRICLAMVDCADTIAMLPGSAQSKGASVEGFYADYVGKTVIPVDQLLAWRRA